MSGNRWQRIEEIFHRAIELAPEARAAFLGEACAGDESLLREVESLLAHESETGTTFVGPAVDPEPRSVAHYRIAGKLGEGGMGAVYRATDTRLRREVAIKLLPGMFAGDARRMARFEREAQVLAALNHPNIATIYGIEEGAIVMELVDGQELKGPLPVGTAIHYARQIADALEAAHEKGIVHRDLKPANIKVTEDGRVKVLDFGLAKAFDRETAGGEPATPPGLRKDATDAGVILGTAGYMSPEQARGKPVDRRSDIWAFGVVFLEMLTGRRTFEGETAPDTLAAVLHGSIDWSRLPAETPPKVRRLLERCLERDPKRRLRDIGDAWLEIDALEEAQPPVRRPGVLAGVAAAAVAAGLAAGWLIWHSAPLPPPPVARWSELVTADQVAVSPDGTRLLYRDGLHARTYLRMLDHFDSQAVEGFAGMMAVFSPDGQWVAFNSGTGVKKAPSMGGTPVTLSGEPGSGQGDWGDDGSIVFSSGRGLMRISGQDGTAQALTIVDGKKGERAHVLPHLLPGGRGILFTIRGGSAEQTRIALLDLRTGARRTIRENASDGRYVPGGYLVYIRGATLLAAPFDLKRMEVTGGEAAMAGGLLTNTLGSAYAVSSTGILAYLSAGSPESEGLSTMEWRNRQGKPEPAMPARLWLNASVSPDGSRVVASISSRGVRAHSADLWVYEIARGTLTRLTFDESSVQGIWTPDGRRIVISSQTDRRVGIYWVPSDFSGSPELLVLGDGHDQRPQCWTPDGKSLLYVTGPSSKREVWLVSVPGGQPGRFLQGPGNIIAARISPDGKWVGLESTESGRSEVYVQSFPGLGAKVQVSDGGGTSPRWRSGGGELYYGQPGVSTQDPARLMAAQIQVKSGFHVTSSHALFEIPAGATWDPVPDGKSFLVENVTEASRNPKVTLRVVTEWFEELRRSVPAH